MADFAPIPLPVLRWQCDLARPAPQRIQIFRGETVRLEALLVLNGAAATIPPGATATLAWQSRDMGSSWYTATANLDAQRGAVYADFGPDKDAGAGEYRAFLRVDTDGACYRVFAALQILPSPGAVINEIPIPPRVLDFATIEVLNAPYWTKTEADERFASVADATLNGRGLGAWVVTPPTEDGVQLVPLWDAENHWWNLCKAGSTSSIASPDNVPSTEDATELSWTGRVKYTATRTALPGYVLGSQTDKPLAGIADVPAVVAPSTTAADAGKAADAKATGDALDGKLDKAGGIQGLTVLAIETGRLNVNHASVANAGFGPEGISHDVPDGVVKTLEFPLKSGTIALTSDIPAVSAETWTFEVDDGQGGTTTVTKSVAVFAQAAQGGV